MEFVRYFCFYNPIKRLIQMKKELEGLLILTKIPMGTNGLLPILMVKLLFRLDFIMKCQIKRKPS